MIKDQYFYITNIINYLNTKFGVEFFITPNDFDILIRWSEKKIPLRVIRQSIEIVVKRWGKKEKKVTSFTNFSYEVKKRFALSTDLELGRHLKDVTHDQSEKKENIDEFECFFENIPDSLSDLRKEIDTIYKRIKAKTLSESLINEFYVKLLQNFEDDYDLNLKSGKFLKSLPEHFQNEQMENKWKINYILNKFKIPLLESF